MGTRIIDGHRVSTDAATSRRMADIRQAGTTPELRVRRALSALGVRYCLRNRNLHGSPDIANRTRRWAIFVHGCFWHRHRGCRRTTTPKRNAGFWQAKFEANQMRDQRAISALRRDGYRVLVVWECDTQRDARLRRALTIFARGLLRDRSG